MVFRSPRERKRHKIVYENHRRDFANDRRRRLNLDSFVSGSSVVSMVKGIPPIERIMFFNCTDEIILCFGE